MSNQMVTVSDNLTIMIDLWFDEWGCALEYEGGHHQADRVQYVADIDRYSLMRRAQIDYRQVTKERLNAPRSLVRMVHQLLLDNGYDGPSPEFGARWESLFRRLSEVVERRKPPKPRRAVS